MEYVMTSANLFRWIAIVLFCLPAFLFAESGTLTADADTTRTNPASNHKILVYYLYFNPRCETCINMEIFSKEAVETGFADELKGGSIEWHAYDIEKPEHKHFWDDYELETKALIMLEVRDGQPVRWKNCEKIWDLAEDKAAFVAYVQKEVATYLKGDRR